MKYAIRFSRGGILRFLSYRETMNAIERTLRRAEIPLAYTQGFHPHMKVSYSPAVLTGVASAGIYLTVETTEQADNLVETLNSVNKTPLLALGAWEIDKKMKIDDFLDSYSFNLFLPSNKFDPDQFNPEIKVTKKTKRSERVFSASEAFHITKILTLRNYFMVKYTQSVEAMVPFTELLKIMTKEITASQEGVYVFVNDGIFKNNLTSDILDNVGGINNVRS